MQVAFYLAGEITQVKESIPWVRCASGNVLVLTCRQALICRWYWQTHRWPPVSVESKTPRFQKSRANYEPGQIIWLRCCVVIELKHWQKNFKREYFGCIGDRQDNFTNGSIKDNENLPSLQNSKRYKYYHIRFRVSLRLLECGVIRSLLMTQRTTFRWSLERSILKMAHLVVCYEQLWVDVHQLTDRHSLWKLSQLI